MILESSTVVVAKALSRGRAVCKREAKNKKHVIPALVGNDGRRSDEVSSCIPLPTSLPTLLPTSLPTSLPTLLPTSLPTLLRTWKNLNGAEQGML